MLWYFDVLPYHPPPREHESLTSYLMLVAAGNRIKSVNGLSELLFPDQSIRVTRSLADFPPLTKIWLIRGLSRTEDEINRTTFYHLGRKFHRSTHPQALSRFMTGAISDTLRYCPICVAENRFYRLTWRFKMLVGCARHDVYLRETCPYCRQRVPLFAAPFHIGYCPHCYHDLSASSVIPLNAIDQRTAHNMSISLQFLLNPWTFQLHDNSMVNLGKQFKRARRRKGLTTIQAASAAGIALNSLTSIERGSVQSGATFANIMQYTKFLGMSISEAFRSLTDADDPIEVADPRIEEVQTALEHMLGSDITITFRALSLETNIPASTIRNHTELEPLVHTAIVTQSAERKHAFLSAVQLAIASLDTNVSVRSVSRALDVPRSRLRNMPEALELIYKARC